MITVALVESLALIREALKTLLNAGAEVTVVADTPHAAEMLSILQHSSADVVVLSLDATFAERDAALSAFVHQDSRPCRVLVLTSDTDRTRDVHVMALGARGVVRKNVTGTVLLRAISTVHAGDLWIDRSTLTTLVQSLTRGESRDSETARVQSLTAREREVITLVADGFTNTRIAGCLFISAATVRNHLSSILSKLDLTDRFQLAVYAFRRGLVLCPPTTAMLQMFAVMTARRPRSSRPTTASRRWG
jgi:DNA-binding NarL/FixJ family response regulator